MTWATNRERQKLKRRVITVPYMHRETGERVLWVVPLRCSPALMRAVERAFARRGYVRES